MTFGVTIRAGVRARLGDLLVKVLNSTVYISYLCVTLIRYSVLKLHNNDAVIKRTLLNIEPNPVLT